MGRPTTSNFGGTVPLVPLRSPPLPAADLAIGPGRAYDLRLPSGEWSS